MSAPIEWANGPRLDRDYLDLETRRRVATVPSRIVIDVKVGKNNKLRQIELDEADLLTIIRRAAEVLSALKVRRDSA